jgi:hypothetical protein
MGEWMTALGARASRNTQGSMSHDLWLRLPAATQRVVELNES